jgi:hypothetical protein
MDLSSQSNADEDRIMQRQLYRAGEGSKPAPKTPASPSSIKSAAAVPPRNLGKKGGSPASDKSTKGQRILQRILLLGFGYYLLYGTVDQRRRVLKGFGVAAWLLFLCGASYCIFLPNLEGIAKDISNKQKAIWEDKSLTSDQKREKMGEIRSELSKLTPEQRRAVFQINMKQKIREGNKEIVGFLQLSKEDQFATMKKRVDDMEKRRAQWGARQRNNKGQGGGANGGGGPGGGGPGGGRPGGGGPGWGGGPRGGGGGGGGGGPDTISGMAAAMSPEQRAGRMYQAGMMQKMGGFGGGQGGGGRGGPGGPPPGGGGGPR